MELAGSTPLGMIFVRPSIRSVLVLDILMPSITRKISDSEQLTIAIQIDMSSSRYVFNVCSILFFVYGFSCMLNH